MSFFDIDLTPSINYECSKCEFSLFFQKISRLLEEYKKSSNRYLVIQKIFLFLDSDLSKKIVFSQEKLLKSVREKIIELEHKLDQKLEESSMKDEELVNLKPIFESCKRRYF